MITETNYSFSIIHHLNNLPVVALTVISINNHSIAEVSWIFQLFDALSDTSWVMQRGIKLHVHHSSN